MKRYDTEKSVLTGYRGEHIKVSPEDYEQLSQYKWHVGKKDGYAYRTLYSPKTQTNVKLSMSRVIMDTIDKDWKTVKVDHINGDKLDNRRENLRIVTSQQNSWNKRKYKEGRTSSNYRGVTRVYKKWRANIHTNGKTFYLGTYIEEKDAAKAYDTAALKYFGEYAQLNFPAVVAVQEAEG